MARLDLDTVVSWTMYVITATFAFGVIAFLIVGTIDCRSNERAKASCGAEGGKVEHYDPQHQSLWRCIKQAERAP